MIALHDGSFKILNFAKLVFEKPISKDSSSRPKAFLRYAQFRCWYSTGNITEIAVEYEGIDRVVLASRFF